MTASLHAKSTQDLQAELAEKQGDLRSFRFAKAGGKAKNAEAGRTIRKEIARILTELSARRS